MDLNDRIGFTGTQQGLTVPQSLTLKELLESYFDSECEMWFHHGDCIGADAEASAIAKELGYRIELHPPIKTNKRAFCKYDFTNEPKDYLERNLDIIGSVDLLLACPKGPEERRSGTWYTIRHSAAIVPCIIVWPNGTYVEYKGG